MCARSARSRSVGHRPGLSLQKKMEGERGEECVLDEVMEEILLEEGLQALESNQCWGAALATSHADLGHRCYGECIPGFVRGKNHLKNKFCDNCRQGGVFVRVDRVKEMTDDFSNKQSVGMWTKMDTHPDVGYRVINQTHKCKGPRLIVFDCDPPSQMASLSGPSNAYIIDAQWVHLRLANGTLVPSLPHEVIGAPPALLSQHGASDDRGHKRARASGSISTASPNSPSSSPSLVGEWSGPSELAASAPRNLPLLDAAPLDALLAAHADFASLITTSLDSPGICLSHEQHAALTGLVRSVNASANLLRGTVTSSHQDLSTERQALFFDHELLSWPPSPPGTATSGRRQLGGTSSSSMASWRTQPSLSSFWALFYLYSLILCASSIAGQTLVAILTYWFPQLCEGPTQGDPPMVITYALIVTVTLALNLLVAEAVGLVPARYLRHFSHSPCAAHALLMTCQPLIWLRRYANYHLLSGLTRCCLYRQRRKWSRISASEIAQPPEIPLGGMGPATRLGNVRPPSQVADRPTTELQKTTSSPLYAWLAWTATALVVTLYGTVIWVVSAHANAINLVHAKHMVANGNVSSADPKVSDLSVMFLRQG